MSTIQVDTITNTAGTVSKSVASDLVWAGKTRTYMVQDNTDFTPAYGYNSLTLPSVATNMSVLANFGTINIPTKGIIKLETFGRIYGAGAYGTVCGVISVGGVKIAGNAGSPIPYIAYTSGTAGSTITLNCPTIYDFSIENSGIPTGNQNVQVLSCYWNDSGYTQGTLKGTQVPTRIYITITDHS
jgi:hypothetical protein